MDTITKKRFLIGTIIILIVINISALGTMAFNKYQQSQNVGFNNDTIQNQNNQKINQRRINHGRVKYFVKRELSLSDEQFEQYSILKDANIEKSRLLMQEIGDNKILVFKEFCKENQDTLKLKQLADKIGSLHTQMQNETLRHFYAIEKILSPEQLTKFKIMLCDMSNKKDRNFHKQGKRDRRGRK